MLSVDTYLTPVNCGSMGLCPSLNVTQFRTRNFKFTGAVRNSSNHDRESDRAGRGRGSESRPLNLMILRPNSLSNRSWGLIIPSGSAPGPGRGADQRTRGIAQALSLGEAFIYSVRLSAGLPGTRSRLELE